MRKVFILLLFNSPAFAGPLVGHVTDGSAVIWADTEMGTPATVRFWPAADPAVVTEVNMRENSDRDMRVTLTDLVPDQDYGYEVVAGGARDPDWTGSFKTAPRTGSPTVFSVAVTSCINFWRGLVDQPQWAELQAEAHQLLFLIGDNIYADTTDYDVKWSKHRLQRTIPEFADVLRNIPTYATWDDHDYAANDSDGSAPGKQNSLRAFTEVWANPGAGTADTDGVFYSFSYGDVDFFVLDTRYHRSPNWAANDANKKMLGDGQFNWLSDHLTTSTATFKVIIQGDTLEWQLQNGEDDWGAFDHARTRLYGLISDHAINGVIFVGGDIHKSLLRPVYTAEAAGYPIWEVIGSGMSTGYSDDTDGRDQWATLSFDTTAPDPWIRVGVSQVGGRTPFSQTIHLSELMAVSDLQFATPSHRVSEVDGEATIEVTRTGYLEGAVSVDYVVEPMSGDQEAFTPLSGTLHFAENENSQILAVPFSDDDRALGDLRLRVSLSDPMGLARLGDVPTATLTVADDESNQAPTVELGPDLAGPSMTRSLSAIVSDDDADVILLWSVARGPAGAEFSSPTALATDITFSEYGLYVIRLEATDGELSGFDEVNVAVTRDGLVAHYAFESQRGDAIIDHSGLGNDTTRLDPGPDWTAGNGRAALDMVGFYGVLMAAVPQATSRQMTLVMRLKLDSFGHYFGTYLSGRAGEYGLWLDAGTGHVSFSRQYDSGTNGNWRTPDAIFTEGSWHHLAIAMDPLDARIYVDGADVTTAGATPPRGRAVSTGADFGLGNLPPGNIYGLHGELADVQIYDRALDALEIASIEAQNEPPWVGLDTDLTLVDDDDDGSENVVLDASSAVDVEGEALSFGWRQHNVVLGDAPRLTRSLPLGIHLITLTVTDASGGIDSRVITIRVEQPSLVPQVDTGDSGIPVDVADAGGLPNDADGGVPNGPGEGTADLGINPGPGPSDRPADIDEGPSGGSIGCSHAAFGERPTGLGWALILLLILTPRRRRFS